MNFRPRGTRSKVGVRPIIEVRPILGNLRYFELTFKTLGIYLMMHNNH